STLPALVARPDLLLRGVFWLRRIHRAGVPILLRHGIAAVHGSGACERVELQPVDANRRLLTDRPARSFAADPVAVGHGLVPATEVPRLLRADHRFDPALGGWVVERDEFCRASLPDLYVAGDGAGIGGAAVAHLEGQLAGLTAARDL